MIRMRGMTVVAMCSMTAESAPKLLDITRSGENYEFGRAVVRALYKTMPREDARGRVTVRLILSQDGNLVEVRLARSSGNPALDQEMVWPS